MKVNEFKKQLGNALLAEKSTAKVIADLAFLTIEHYHKHSFNRDLVEAMQEGLARRKTLSSKYEQIVKDCTVKKGVKKADKPKAKELARRGYAWLKQQNLARLTDYVVLEKRPATGILKPAPAATFASQKPDTAQAVLNAEEKVKKIRIALRDAENDLATACEMAHIPAPSVGGEVVQDPKLVEKVNQLEQENEKLTQATAELPTVKDQLKTERIKVKDLVEENLKLANQVSAMRQVLEQIAVLNSKSKSKAAQEIAELLASVA